jgi:hypothetical protein
MNDKEFDELIRQSLARRAEREIAQHAPAKLAFRRLAVRIGDVGDVGDQQQVSVRLNADRERTRSGSRMQRLVLNASAAAVVVVAVVLALAYLGSGDGQFAQGSPVHESARHGYRLRLPDDSWHVTEQPGEWLQGAFLDAETAGVDYFDTAAVPPRGDIVYVWLSSQPIPDGMSFEDWLDAQDRVVQNVQPCFVLQGSYEDVRVDGERGRLGAYRCESFAGSGIPWHTVQLLFEHEGRGYAMYFWPEQEPQAPPLADIRREALRWLPGFEFTEVPGPSL